MRERLAEHRENPACAACHDVMDPIGLGLENFDAVGRWRVREPGGDVRERPSDRSETHRIEGCDDVPWSGSLRRFECHPMIGFEPRSIRVVLDLELDPNVGQCCQDFVEEGRMMPIAEIQLPQHRPRCLGDDETKEVGVVRENELAVGRTTHVELYRIGDR